MNIELKNIKYSPTLSDDSNAFTANLYINGKKVCMVGDDGNGGEVFFRSVDPKYTDLLKEAEKWCKAQPAWMEPNPVNPDKPYQGSMTLDLYICDLLENYLNAKEDQKLERKMAKSLLFGVPGRYYQEVVFKIPIEQMINQPKGHHITAETIKKYIIPELKEGKVFMNTNIPEEIIRAAGLKEGQYVQPKPVKQAEKKKAQRQGPKP